MRDGFNFIVRRIDVFKSVGRLIADGRKAKDAEVAEMINQGILAEGDILNAAKLDNIGRVREDGAARFLNTAAVGDINMVSVVNALSDKTAEAEQDVKQEDNETEVVASSSVHLKDSIIDAGVTLREVDQDEAHSDDHNGDDGPDKHYANTRTLNMKHNILVLLEVDFWEVLGAASVLDL